MIDTEYKTNVVLGDELKAFAEGVKKYEKRDCFCKLSRYLKCESNDRICIIYGLRRTGKTTMLRQAIGELILKQRYPIQWRI